MKIGVIGSGAVGITLANGLQAQGHEIVLGTHSPEKTAELSEKLVGSTVGDFKQAAAHGEVVIFSVKGRAAEQVAIDLATELAGKTVIDTTNPIGDQLPQDGVVGYFTNFSQSLLEKLQTSVPDAKFVKAFNSVGAGDMVNPQFESKPTMFICGNDDIAKQTAKGLIEGLGWEVADMGKAAAARAIEPLCMLWCIPGMLSNDWHHAFKLLTK
ncbi:NAD(P)-binding domain-containing protein [soil metagenome]